MGSFDALEQLVLQTGKFQFNRLNYFIKIGTGGCNCSLDALNYEYECLNRLHKATIEHCEHNIFSPKPLHVGTDSAQNNFIVLDYMDLKSKSNNSPKLLGRGLALLHKKTAENEEYKYFGFPMDGQCGAYPQLNNSAQKHMNWREFWMKYRLLPQVEGIKQKYPHLKSLLSKLEELRINLKVYFPDNLQVGKSLLHGDLWSGNWGNITSKDGTNIAVIFDPASYYGHSEADLGIADMFGMPSDFYEAYFNILPIKDPERYKKRRMIYELHHHLNHLNIFGEGYHDGALALLLRILK